MSSAFSRGLERPLALMVSAGPSPDQENELEAPTMLQVDGPFLVTRIKSLSPPIC